MCIVIFFLSYNISFFRASYLQILFIYFLLFHFNLNLSDNILRIWWSNNVNDLCPTQVNIFVFFF